MRCLQSRDQQLMDRYIHGRLAESEQEAFEAHLADCEDCVDQLKLLGALRAELGQRRSEIQARDTVSPRARWMVWLPVAALLLVGLGLLVTTRFTERSELAGLASIEAPRYEPMQFRGAVDEADERFRQAMQFYVQGDYEAVIPGLEAAALLDPERTDALFFLAACELLTDRIDLAIDHFGPVVKQADVQYLEEALYLRAQAHLLRGDAVGASRDLRSIVELGGGWQQRASSQLEKLEARSD